MEVRFGQPGQPHTVVQNEDSTSHPTYWDVVEAAGKERLANGMKSLSARFARCVNRVFGRKGRVLSDRFHHVVKRTPTEVRRALAYLLLNTRQRDGQ